MSAAKHSAHSDRYLLPGNRLLSRPSESADDLARRMDRPGCIGITRRRPLIGALLVTENLFPTGL